MPLAAAELATGNLPGVLLGAAVGLVTHWLIDATGKYGLGTTVVGIVLDQVSHVVVILVLTMT